MGFNNSKPSKEEVQRAANKGPFSNISIDGSSMGVDFGTSLGCFGIFEKNLPSIIQNVQGKRITDINVIVNSGEFLYGEIAKQKLDRNITNSVYDIIKLVDLSDNNKEYYKVAKYWPFEVSYVHNLETSHINQEKDKITQIKLAYIVQDDSGEITTKTVYLTPEKIIGMVQESFLKLAATKTNNNNYVKDIILATPNNFGYLKKQALSTACTHYAGLNVKKFVKSGRAAALAQKYTYQNDYNTFKNVLFFDLGAGYLDLTLVNYQEGIMTIRATSCDESLGGRVYDIIILEHCLQHFKKQKGINLLENKKALRRLMTQCEKAKIDLSIIKKFEIFVEYIANNEDFSLDLSREKLEELCKEEFEKCIESIRTFQCISRTKKVDIHEVVLTGGSIRIPKITELIEKFFLGGVVKRIFNPDEAVGLGTILHNGLVFEDQYIHSNYLKSKAVNMPLQIFDTTPLNLGININGEMYVLIKKNTILPFKNFASIKPLENDQHFVTIDVLEGNSKSAKQCDLIGRISSTQLDQSAARTRSKKSFSRLQVIFDIDQNFNLEVTLNELNSNQVQKIMISDVMKPEIYCKPTKTDIQLDK